MNTLKVFVHGQQDELDIIPVDLGTSVRDLAADCGETSANVWLENADEPLDPDLTLEAVGVTDQCHIHVSDCREVVVHVRYNGDEKRFESSPAATADHLLRRVAGDEGFGLTEDQRASHMLVLAGADDGLDRDAHIGSVVVEDCVVSLDLSPKHRYQGRESSR